MIKNIFFLGFYFVSCLVKEKNSGRELRVIFLFDCIRLLPLEKFIDFERGVFVCVFCHHHWMHVEAQKVNKFLLNF